MWRRLHSDDKHKTNPARRCTFLFWKGLASFSSLGAAIDSLVTSRGQALLLKANAFSRAKIKLSRHSLWSLTVIDDQNFIFSIKKMAFADHSLR
jgi:hypothetical protein